MKLQGVKMVGMRQDKDSKMTISQLARQEGLTKGYVGCLLKLKLMAPDIVGAILEDNQSKRFEVTIFDKE